MYCRKCGNEIMDEAVICPKCGCLTGTQPLPITQQNSPTSHTQKTSSGLQTATKIFLILSCIGTAISTLSMFASCVSMSELAPELTGIYGFFAVVCIGLFVLDICMTTHYTKAINEGAPVGTAFKVCTLLFVNLIAGILMLCDNGSTENNNQYNTPNNTINNPYGTPNHTNPNSTTTPNNTTNSYSTPYNIPKNNDNNDDSNL